MASTSCSFSSSCNSFESENGQNERMAETLPCILDGNFFIYCRTESTVSKKVAFCVSCQPKEVKICGFNNSTSNFVTHLKRKHGEDIFKNYQRHLKLVKRNKQSSGTYDRREVEIRESSNKSEQTISQDQFNVNILEFFIHSMIPLQSIEDPFFKRIFDSLSISTKGLIVVSKRTLRRLIDDYYKKEIKKIKKELLNIKEVCTTVDIWSTKTRRFLGVTGHWLDSNLERKSKTLACRRLSSTHSYDRIALLLETLHSEFGLDSRKVLTTVSDNGSNFVKAFEEFGVDMDSHRFGDFTESEESSIVVEDFHTEMRSISDFYTQNNFDPLAFVKNNIAQSTILELPVHLRCSAQMLNLCVTTDTNKLLRNNETSIADIHKKVIRKCNKLWNTATRPKSAEIINSIVGHTLYKPEITIWNNLYDALKQIALIQNKSVQLYVALGLTNLLCTQDFQYINEYLCCSKPIAEALDIIEGEKDMYYGILLPCLVSLRKKLRKLNRKSFAFCKKLAEQYLESVEERFYEFFTVSSKVAQNAAVAAMSYPRFKDKWIACLNIEHQSKVKSMFKEAVVKEIQEAPETLQDRTK